MKVNSVDISGKAAGSVSLPEAVFGVKQVKPAVIAQAVKVYLSNQRQGTKRAKTRGDVTGTGKKIWRQKGTGNARHGDRQAPLFVGGGVAHGPKGNENYRRSLPEKMQRLAMKAMLTLKLKEKQVKVIKSFKALKPKAKAVVTMLKRIVEGYEAGKKVMIIGETKEAELVARAGANIEGVKVRTAKDVNVYELGWGTLVLSGEAVEELQQRLKA